MKEKAYKVRTYQEKELSPKEYLAYLLEQKEMYRRLASNERHELAKLALKKQKKAKEYDEKADQFVERAKQIAKLHKLSV
ncbi:MAG TPA: hypothetical protein DDY18_04545 [Flavobacterium sp.]|nr:hypothetical protein [Flavobacterium sp.]